MKYAIIQCINGNYSVYSEGITDVTNAKTQFFGRCQALWNAPDVISGVVMIVDEHLDRVENYKEFISHAPVEPAEPTEE